jgi:hypothetical protein
MTSQMTIGRKLLASFIGMLLMVFGLAYSSLRAIGGLGTAVNDATGPLLHESDLAGIINETNAEMRAAVH